MIVMALRSRFAIIRQSAARCFAAICDVMTVDAMRYVIETVLPFLGDTLVDSNRQGATELVFSTCLYHPVNVTYWRCPIDVVQRLDHKALSYVIFLVVPVLGRMSDPDDDIRSTATNTFASLVKMVPLEVRRYCHHITQTSQFPLGWSTRSSWLPGRTSEATR